MPVQVRAIRLSVAGESRRPNVHRSNGPTPIPSKQPWPDRGPLGLDRTSPFCWPFRAARTAWRCSGRCNHWPPGGASNSWPPISTMNFEARESDADEAFVVELCRQLGVHCAVGKAVGQPGPAVRRRGARSGRPPGPVRLPRTNRRAARRPIRRHRPHRRRSGRDDPAPDPSRHGHRRPVGHGPGAAAGRGRHADPAAAWTFAAPR